MKTTQPTIKGLESYDLVTVKPKFYNKKNLAKLALVLKTLKAKGKFDMSVFLDENPVDISKFDDTPINAADILKSCGSCACAVGWGAAKKIGNPQPCEGWNRYINRVYIHAHLDNAMNNYTSDLFGFLFGTGNPDNAFLAAKRIAFFLIEGCFPLRYYGYGNHRAFRQYKPDWSKIEKLAK
jgi:hypothetical protein